MNKPGEIDGDTLLRTADLAAREDFKLGQATISPGSRTVKGPGGEADLEPRVMQVLVVLVDHAGAVATRETLFQRCWGNVFVGDDSLNRAVAGVRKVAESVAAGSFSVETVPRTGYKLIVHHGARANVTGSTPRPMVTRRALVGGGMAAAAAAGSLGLWYVDAQHDREFDKLMARGEAAVDYRDPADSPVGPLRQAISIRPRDARALGLLAYALALKAGDGTEGAGGAVREAEEAVRAALAVDTDEPTARVAQTLLQRATLDLAANEDRLRSILASDPRNTLAMRHLWDLLQCAGRSRDALAVVERAIALKPLAAGSNFPRAQLLWILGRNGEADRVIHRAMEYWPSHRWVRFARFIIFAFTGRERAALGMLNGRDTAPQGFSPESVAMWRISLIAMESPSATNVAAALDANMTAAKQKPQLSRQAVMTLSRLGEIDAAYEIANAELLFEAPIDGPASPPRKPPGKSTAWIFAPWLFTPPLARFRADARFKTLCDGIGLTEYWATRRVRPDYKIGEA